LGFFRNFSIRGMKVRAYLHILLKKQTGVSEKHVSFVSFVSFIFTLGKLSEEETSVKNGGWKRSFAPKSRPLLQSVGT
jgi:hypothetical protein